MGRKGGHSTGHLPTEKGGVAAARASALPGGQGPEQGYPMPRRRGPDSKPWGRRVDLRVRREAHSFPKQLLSFL